MANAINQPLPGWPAPPGAKPYTTLDHYGPVSYVAYNASTGAGDIVNASDLGAGGIETAGSTWSGYSNSGNYIVTIQQTKANDVPAAGAATRFTVQWFTTSAAFGAKSTEVSGATNLNAEYVRLKLDLV